MNTAWNSVLVGLPILLVHLAVTSGLLMAAVTGYVLFAPYGELKLVREGNVAAGIVMSGQTLALTIPLAAMLAHSVSVPDIVLWGCIAVILQLIAIVAVRLTIRNMTALVQRGEVAPALVLVGGQVAAGILNAAALAA